ncbi:MAG: lysophospholipid acyltransferase family protein [Syntrophales bacterium]|nr:lysophospholipid acyltransferase family protein [Syntrophales bacterium]MDP3096665.1 lysophospholipid acyltransferase family protein [Syntrophales bacterium]
MTTQRLVDIILASFRVIPTPLRKALFIGISRMFHHLIPRQRLIATHNLRRAFPEKSEEEILRIVQGVYRNIGIVAAEFFDIPRLTKENITALVEAEGVENCGKALAKGRGVLMFSAHFGNWELEAAAAALLIKPAVVIYRPLDSPLLDHLVLRVRSATGNIPLAKEHAMRPMLRTLKQNGILGILIDQNMAWYEGVFVDYFGRPACTTDGLALLALHTEAPVLPAYMVRLADGRYRLVFGPEVEVIRTGDRDADVLANTQRFTKVIEEIVRRYPDQWLWVHQRWKTQPCQIPRKERC